MSVVEKESLADDEVQPLSESLSVRKVLGGPNGFPASTTRVNRLPAKRETSPALVRDAQRMMREQSLELQAFVSPLEAQIRRALKYRSKKHRRTIQAQAKVASLVLHIVREIAHRETGIFNLEPNVPQLLSVLFAGANEVGIVSGLVRRAQRVLALRDQFVRDEGNAGTSSASGTSNSSYDIGRELDELTMLLKWYVRRKMSVAALGVDIGETVGLFEEERQYLLDERDALFSFETMHDHQVFGSKGCLLSCGLRLIGWDGQLLWLRVAVRRGGSSVAVRSAWETWTDPGSGADVEVIPKSAPFCSLVPIRPNSQRLIIDEIRAFVPYAALDLPEGRCEVEFVVSVIDNDGREILEVSREESVCVPRADLTDAVVPAPHSVGMWPHDVVLGDKISDLVLGAGFKVVAGWERHTISVQFDVSLFMHAGESVMLECRFRDRKGRAVELSSLGIPFVASELNVAVESVTSYRYRRVLNPKGAWAFYQGLCIDIPVEFLMLAEGLHDLTCEVVLVSSDERVLCGDMGRVSLHVPSRVARHEVADFNHVLTALEVATGPSDSSAIELESFDVDSAWSFDGRESIRIQATFCPRQTGQQIADLAAGRVGELFAPYRVEISLEREDGHVLLQAFTDALGMSFKPVTRAVCVEGQTGFREHCVVASFPKDEVLGWSVGADGARNGAKTRLFARVSALTPAGEILVTEHKEFFVRPSATGGRDVVEIKAPAATIVDVVARTFAQGQKLSVRTLINLPSAELSEDGIVIRSTIVSSDGTRRVVGSHALQPPREAVWTRRQIGLSQIAVEMECDVAGNTNISPSTVEIALISATQAVLQTVTQLVQAEGPLGNVEESGQEPASPQEDVPPAASEDSFAEVEARAFGGTKKKGLLARLFAG